MHYQGRFTASLAYCERVIALSDPASDPAGAFQGRRTQYQNPRVAALDIAAWNLWYLGHADRALGRAREGVALARALAYPFDLAFALFFETVVHRLRRDPGAQRECAAEVIALGDVQDFPLWRGVGHMYHGLGRVRAGEGAAALAEVAEGLALAASTGNRGGVPGLLNALADGQRTVGQHAEALNTVESGLAVAAATGQHFQDASLHCLKGELLLATEPANAAEAEALFQRALDIARAQEAKSFELRPGMSLARLWRDQGRSADARALLAPIYAWFTEGFDTGDLREAKALLEELA
jgi:predicted ATPase